MPLEKDFPPMIGDGPVTVQTRAKVMSGEIKTKYAKKRLTEARYEDWKNSQKYTDKQP